MLADEHYAKALAINKERTKAAMVIFKIVHIINMSTNLILLLNNTNVQNHTIIGPLTFSNGVRKEL